MLNKSIEERLADIEAKQNLIITLLAERANNNVVQKEILNIDETAELLNISKKTLYKWNCEKRIPYHKMEGSSKPFYKRSEIENFMTKIKFNSFYEIEREADSYIATHPVNKKGRK